MRDLTEPNWQGSKGQLGGRSVALLTLTGLKCVAVAETLAKRGIFISSAPEAAHRGLNRILRT